MIFVSYRKLRGWIYSSALKKCHPCFGAGYHSTFFGSVASINHATARL